MTNIYIYIYIHYFVMIYLLQDIESSRSYIDELYSTEPQKCLNAIM
jgi:hypothetical protein